MRKKETPAYTGAQIEFYGNSVVTVDGCKEILEYEPETVKLNVGRYNIRFVGKNLTLKNLTDKTITVEGCFYNLEFNC
ncbi:MAG: hypothetical protein DBX47_02110 [Clostridiales bacterium]|nr:MAG: hypothetical protein DBX47_02110 [Clostridiales bacterium]